MNKNKNIIFSITISNKDFEKIRDDTQFKLILTLTRILNSMRFSWTSTVNLGGNDTPASRRDRTASFLYMCALLYESFENVYPKLNKEFHHLQSFKLGLKNLKKDSIRINYHDKIFKKVRNKFVFHFDTEVIEDILKTAIVNKEKEILGATHSNQTGDMDFPFTDELIYNYLMETS